MEADLQPTASPKESPAPRESPVAPTEQRDGLTLNLPNQPTNIYDPTSSNLDSCKQNDPATEEDTASTSAERSKLPDTRVHTDWKPSAVAMAKCDICDKRGRGTVYMCQSCSQSVCYECCEQGRLGPGHVLDHKSVPWDVHLTWKQEKPKKKRVATRSATPRGGRGRGGRARGGVTKRRGSRAGSTLSITTREPTQELEEANALNRSSTSSSLSDPPTDHGSPPPQPFVQHAQEPRIQEIRPLAPKSTSAVHGQQELPRLLPRIVEMGPREPQVFRERLGSSSARPYQSPYLAPDHRYHPYSRPPPPTSYGSQHGFNEHNIPREEHQPPFRALAIREPPPQHGGPPTSFETYRRPHHNPRLADYAREAHTRIPQPVSEPKFNHRMSLLRGTASRPPKFHSNHPRGVAGLKSRDTLVHGHLSSLESWEAGSFTKCQRAICFQDVGSCIKRDVCSAKCSQEPFCETVVEGFGGTDGC